MTLAQFIAIVRARWPSGLLVLLTLVGIALGLTYMSAKQYTAVASVMVDVKTPDPIAGMVLQGMSSPSYMATQVDVIRSQRVAQRVAQSLGLLQNPAFREQWMEATKGQGSLEAYAGLALRKGLDVRPSRGSNVINVSFTAGDPKFAAALANAFVQSYLDLSVDLRVDPAKQYNVFFDDRARQLRDKLEAAQTKLSSYQREKGILATDERFDIETARLNELSTQLVVLQATAADSGGRQAQAAINADRMQEVLNNPLVSGLTADVSRQEARLKEMSERIGDGHPQVIEAKANIAELRRRISAETSRVSSSLGINNSINQSRLGQLQTALAQQRAKVLKLKEQRDEAAVLQRDVENAQRSYDGVLARANISSLESQTAQTNVSRLELATEPLIPSSIGLREAGGLALVLGLILSSITMCMREAFDRRLRNTTDVATVLMQPLLGTLPALALGKPSGETGARSAFLQRRVLSGLLKSS